MGKADFFSPKSIGNRIKAKGLQKLRWYCQMCEKQCRDENGFKCHLDSETHERQMQLFRENSGKYLDQNSRELQSVFLKILSSRFSTKRVLANTVYQEYIGDRNHVHLNATHFPSLAAFVKHLGKEKLCEVDEEERGWYIRWIDNGPQAMARRMADAKKEREELSAEQREQRLIAEQIKNSHAAEVNAQALEEEKSKQSILIRSEDDGPIKLAMSLGGKAKEAGEGESTPSLGLKKIGGFSLKKGSLLKGNALKSKSKGEKRKQRPLDEDDQEVITMGRKVSNMESLRREEEARKRSRY